MASPAFDSGQGGSGGDGGRDDEDQWWKKRSGGWSDWDAGWQDKSTEAKEEDDSGWKDDDWKWKGNWQWSTEERYNKGAVKSRMNRAKARESQSELNLARRRLGDPVSGMPLQQQIRYEAFVKAHLNMIAMAEMQALAEHARGEALNLSPTEADAYLAMSRAAIGTQPASSNPVPKQFNPGLIPVPVPKAAEPSLMSQLAHPGIQQPTMPKPSMPNQLPKQQGMFAPAMVNQTLGHPTPMTPPAKNPPTQIPPPAMWRPPLSEFNRANWVGPARAVPGELVGPQTPSEPRGSTAAPGTPVVKLITPVQQATAALLELQAKSKPTAHQAGTASSSSSACGLPSKGKGKGKGQTKDEP